MAGAYPDPYGTVPPPLPGAGYVPPPPGGNPWVPLICAGIAFCVLLLVGAGFLLFSSSTQEHPSLATPPPAEAPADPLPRETAAVPRMAAPPPAPPPHPAESLAKEVPEAELQPLSPSPPARGGLVVNTVPSGARVEVDGEYVGTTPVQLSAVPAGDHRVAVSLSGYEGQRFVATVTGSGTFNSGLVPLTRLPQENAAITSAQPASRTFQPAEINLNAAAAEVITASLRARSHNDTPAEAAAYSDPVDYYDEGTLGGAALRRSIESFHRMWPVYSVSGLSDYSFTPTGQSGMVTATFTFSFQASNPGNGKVSRGLAHEQVWVRQIGSRCYIVKCRESVSNRSKNWR